jgi:secreted Zn-dependent insulinase-like peptidase
MKNKCADRFKKRCQKTFTKWGNITADEKLLKLPTVSFETCAVILKVKPEKEPKKLHIVFPLDVTLSTLKVKCP